jgi:hypothetical protein
MKDGKPQIGINRVDYAIIGYFDIGNVSWINIRVPKEIRRPLKGPINEAR